MFNSQTTENQNIANCFFSKKFITNRRIKTINNQKGPKKGPSHQSEKNGNGFGRSLDVNSNLQFLFYSGNLFHIKKVAKKATFYYSFYQGLFYVTPVFTTFNTV
jgi:hypothetical protein